MDRQNAQLSGEYANGLCVPTVEDKALVHVKYAQSILTQDSNVCSQMNIRNKSSKYEFFEKD